MTEDKAQRGDVQAGEKRGILTKRHQRKIEIEPLTCLWSGKYFDYAQNKHTNCFGQKLNRPNNKIHLCVKKI